MQGCYSALCALLDRLRFDPENDRLWFTGDLVNRGPQSAEVLRFVASLGERAVTVLGNHDLHLLAVSAGIGHRHPRDTLSDVLEAPDRDILLDWLARRPLLHHDGALGYTLVHAGLVPQWDLLQARELATEVEAVLRGPERAQLCAHMYGDMPDCWDDSLEDYPRLRFIVNVCTRLRYCDAEGRIDLSHKGSPGTQPAELMPWFQVPSRKSCSARVIFGHWSALGLWNSDNVIGLDTGCLWGRCLTAARLDGPAVSFISVPCTRAHNQNID